MALTLKSLVTNDCKQIDRQTKRETSGLGRIEPKWAQNKRKIPTVDTILRDVPPSFTGGYGPKAKKHPEVGKVYLASKASKPWKMTEGDIPFDAKIEKHSLRDAKAEGKMFAFRQPKPEWSLGVEKGEPGKVAKGDSQINRKHSRPIITSRPMLEGRKFNTLRPPLATPEYKFEQFLRG
jgi:hypothetical protein